MTLDGEEIRLPDPGRPSGQLIAYCDLCRAIERMVKEYGEREAVVLGDFLLTCVRAGREFPL